MINNNFSSTYIIISTAQLQAPADRPAVKSPKDCSQCEEELARQRLINMQLQQQIQKATTASEAHLASLIAIERELHLANETIDTKDAAIKTLQQLVAKTPTEEEPSVTATLRAERDQAAATAADLSHRLHTADEQLELIRKEAGFYQQQYIAQGTRIDGLDLTITRLTSVADGLREDLHTGQHHLHTTKEQLDASILSEKQLNTQVLLLRDECTKLLRKVGRYESTFQMMITKRKPSRKHDFGIEPFTKHGRTVARTFANTDDFSSDSEVELEPEYLDLLASHARQRGIPRYQAHHTATISPLRTVSRSSTSEDRPTPPQTLEGQPNDGAQPSQTRYVITDEKKASTAMSPHHDHFSPLVGDERRDGVSIKSFLKQYNKWADAAGIEADRLRIYCLKPFLSPRSDIAETYSSLFTGKLTWEIFQTALCDEHPATLTDTQRREKLNTLRVHHQCNPRKISAKIQEISDSLDNPEGLPVHEMFTAFNMACPDEFFGNISTNSDYPAWVDAGTREAFALYISHAQAVWKRWSQRPVACMVPPAGDNKTPPRPPSSKAPVTTSAVIPTPSILPMQGHSEDNAAVVRAIKEATEKLAHDQERLFKEQDDKLQRNLRERDQDIKRSMQQGFNDAALKESNAFIALSASREAATRFIKAEMAQRTQALPYNRFPRPEARTPFPTQTYETRGHPQNTPPPRSEQIHQGQNASQQRQDNRQDQGNPRTNQTPPRPEFSSPRQDQGQYRQPSSAPRQDQRTNTNHRPGTPEPAQPQGGQSRPPQSRLPTRHSPRFQDPALSVLEYDPDNHEFMECLLYNQRQCDICATECNAEEEDWIDSSLAVLSNTHQACQTDCREKFQDFPQEEYDNAFETIYRPQLTQMQHDIVNGARNKHMLTVQDS